MTLPKVDAAKTFVIIAGDDGDLARGIAMSLLEDKRLLHEKFNGSRMPPWQSVTNHLADGVTRDEIYASLDHVLNDSKRFMMILSGYRNNDEWNGALADFMATNNLSASFINSDGEPPPARLRAQFHAYGEMPEVVENGDPINWARTVIGRARQASAIPMDAFDKIKLN
jgi:hypothetical protein